MTPHWVTRATPARVPLTRKESCVNFWTKIEMVRECHLRSEIRHPTRSAISGIEETPWGCHYRYERDTRGGGVSGADQVPQGWMRHPWGAISGVDETPGGATWKPTPRVYAKLMWTPSRAADCPPPSQPRPLCRGSRTPCAAATRRRAPCYRPAVPSSCCDSRTSPGRSPAGSTRALINVKAAQSHFHTQFGWTQCPVPTQPLAATFTDAAPSQQGLTRGALQCTGRVIKLREALV